MQARKSTCKVDGCDTNTLAKGMCAKHYQRVSRKGTVDTGDRFNDPEDSFASRTEANPDGNQGQGRAWASPRRRSY